MNYFTKEWYELCQNTSLHYSLEEEKQAETYSEEYFQQLYHNKLKELSDSQQQIASNIVGIEQFDREKVSEQFHDFINHKEYIEKALPTEILKEIADIRVFMLGKASLQVIKAVTQFCEENSKSMQRTLEEYRNYYKESSKSFDKKVVDNINFHDCYITNINQTEKALTILFDNSGGFTDIDEVIFENYKVIKQDGLLQNTWWLYDEIYKVNDKYELHVLLQNKNMDLLEFIIYFENIVFKYN